jgi:hypothetical protein
LIPSPPNLHYSSAVSLFSDEGITRSCTRSGRKIRMPTRYPDEEGNRAAAIHASGCPVLRSLRTRARQENNMHENREISNAPSFVCEGRSAKVLSRNADMHALEQSDCAVVPMNRPNKTAKLLRGLGREGHCWRRTSLSRACS